MDVSSLSSTHYSHSSHPFTTAKRHRTSAPITPLTLSLKPPLTPDSDNPTTSSSFSGKVRRPNTQKPLKTSPSKPPTSNPRISKNPLKSLVSPTNNPITNPQSLNLLRLTSKLSPPPPPPPPPAIALTHSEENEIEDTGVVSVTDKPREREFREEGKIFVGNLPLWIKKQELSDFFRQFGPIKNVILIKGHNDIERNMGFGFVLYDGPTEEKSAMKAVEFDGVEFHGRVLTVKLDDGRRMKEKWAERARWVEGGNGVEYKSNWHEERDGSRKEFQRVLESQPENWQAVVSSFERIKKPSRKEFGLMVNYYARRGDMHRARGTFESMRARGIEPTSHVYTRYCLFLDRMSYNNLAISLGLLADCDSANSLGLIHAYSVGRDMEEALSCVRKMEDEGVDMSLVTYSVLVGGFAKVGNIEAADRWFKEAKERHATLNSIIYGNIIYAYCQNCNMEKAEALVREMEEDGIDAPIDIYHTMMDGYTMVGDEEKCLVVFSRLKECGFSPSIFSYGCLINLYTKIGKVSKALEVSNIMKSAGIKHNLKTYSMLINGFIRLKDWANAFAIYEDVMRDGLKPDVVLYNSIVRAFCGMGNMDRALRTVEQMQKERRRPTSRTFMPIIHGFARAGDMRRALEVFDLMRRSGCIPTVYTFNALTLGLVEKRQMEKAVGILDEMSLAGISPDHHTYTTIMHGYASVGDIGKAFEYFTKVKNEGLKLDVFVYEALLKACCKSGRMQSALAVTKEMSTQKIPRNTFVFNILIDGWARRGDVWEAADLIQQMKQEGVQPDIHTYTSFINACCKAGDMLQATKTIEEMKSVGVTPNVKTYTTLIHGWARASLPEKALRCFQEMKMAGLKPDKAVYHCLMTSLLSRATVAEEYIYSGILSVCGEMLESGLTVDMGTAVHWSKCLRKIERTGGDITEALQKTFPPDWNLHSSVYADPSLENNDDVIETSGDEDGESNYDDSDVDSEEEEEDNHIGRTRHDHRHWF